MAPSERLRSYYLRRRVCSMDADLLGEPALKGSRLPLSQNASRNSRRSIAAVSNLGRRIVLKATTPTAGLRPSGRISTSLVVCESTDSLVRPLWVLGHVYLQFHHSRLSLDTIFVPVARFLCKSSSEV